MSKKDKLTVLDFAVAEYLKVVEEIHWSWQWYVEMEKTNECMIWDYHVKITDINKLWFPNLFYEIYTQKWWKIFE